MMWKAAVLAVCLLLTGVRAYDGPSYGVKLCGREFIRAVIFTCGGSRWRRSITSTGKHFTIHASLCTILLLRAENSVHCCIRHIGHEEFMRRTSFFIFFFTTEYHVYQFHLSCDMTLQLVLHPLSF